MNSKRCQWVVSFLVFLGTVILFDLPVQANDSELSYDQVIIEDWARQERRNNRSMYDPAAIQELWQRTQALLHDLRRLSSPGDYQSEAAQLQDLEEPVGKLETLDLGQRLELYLTLRTVTRKLALRNPLLAGKKLVFMQRRRFICQMLHEYLGYYYDYGDISGGGIYVLEKPGDSFEIRDLIQGRLPRGNFTTPALSYDVKGRLKSTTRGQFKIDHVEERLIGLLKLPKNGSLTWPIRSAWYRRIRS